MLGYDYVRCLRDIFGSRSSKVEFSKCPKRSPTASRTLEMTTWRAYVTFRGQGCSRSIVGKRTWALPGPLGAKICYSDGQGQRSRSFHNLDDTKKKLNTHETVGKPDGRVRSRQRINKSHPRSNFQKCLEWSPRPTFWWSRSKVDIMFKPRWTPTKLIPHETVGKPDGCVRSSPKINKLTFWRSRSKVEGKS